MAQTKTIVEIYTDGACRGNPGPGGWGALLRYGDTEKEISGAVTLTTNNQMELTAAIEALRLLKRSCVIDLYTDSEYLRLGITQWLAQWKSRQWLTSQKQPVKNVELWQQLDELTQPHQIQWHWVKAHNGHIENERVDLLARNAIDQLMQQKEESKE